jgi:transcriptional regulator with XRE-family HTH domain
MLVVFRAMPARIGPKRRRRIYLREWREHRGLTQEQLANRLGTTNITVSRWELRTSLLNTNVMDAVAEALGHGMEAEDLYHHPDRPTANMLLRDQPADIQEQALKLIQAIRR